MITEIKAIVSRSADHLLEDFVGAAALILMLLVGLHLLPGMT